MNLDIYNIIEEICNEKEIKHKLLSKDWILMLEKNNKTRFISGYKFDSNSHALGTILDDKYALYEILKEKNIPIIEHQIVYNPNNRLSYAIGCNTYEYVEKYLKKHNNSIVIKPNDGTCGNNVYHIQNIDELTNILDTLFIKHHSLCMCPYYEIENEYRIILLNGEVQLCYEKNLPKAVGDGTSSIRELLIEFNPSYFSNKLSDSKYDRILKKDEIYTYNWKFNLSQGSISKTIEDNKLKENLMTIVNKIYNFIDVNFVSIDIIKTRDNNLQVLEINSGVMLENYLKQHPDERDKIKEIYKKAIGNLF